jgi:hypothetical protein
MKSSTPKLFFPPPSGVRAAGSQPASTETRGVLPPHDRKLAIRVLTLACMVAVWSIVLGLAFFPGLMSADPLVSLEQGILGSYDNTNPPLLGALAGLSYKLTGSVWPLLVVQLVALGGGMAALAGRMRSGLVAVVLLTIFLALPTVWSTAVIVWKDVASCAAMLLAVVALAFRRPWLGTLLLVLAATCRLNAILGVLPLAYWAGFQISVANSSRARHALIALLIVLGGVALPKVIDRVFKARDAWALGLVLADDLAAIYARVPEAFAGSMLASDTSAADLARLYSPDSDVPLFYGGPDGLHRINLSLLPNRRAELMREWVRIVFSHPGVYLKTRALRFKNLLGLGRDVVYYPFHTAIDPNAFGLSLARADRQPYLALRNVQEWARNKLFRGWIWLTLLFAAAATSYHLHRGRALATWVAGSGIVYALGYFVLAPAADFRYLFWSMVSAFATLALLGTERDEARA